MKMLNASAVRRLNSRNVDGRGGRVPAGWDGWRQLMRHIVLQFWLSLDGCGRRESRHCAPPCRGGRFIGGPPQCGRRGLRTWRSALGPLSCPSTGLDY